MNEQQSCPQRQTGSEPRTDVDDLIFREQPDWLASDR